MASSKVSGSVVRLEPRPMWRVSEKAAGVDWGWGPDCEAKHCG